MSDVIHKAAGIIIQNKKILVQRTKGKEIFVAPGGKLEPGETAVQALIRELKEEIQIDVDPKDLVPFGTYSAPAAYSPENMLQMEVFIVNKWAGEIVPDNEIEEIIWIPSEIPQNIEVGSIFTHDVLPRLKEKGLID